MGKHRPARKTEYSFPAALGKTVFLSALMLLCFYSSLWMIQDVFPDWQISRPAQRWICALVFLTAAVYETGIRALPQCRRLCRLAVPLLYAGALYRYVRPRQIDFEDGLCALAAQFLVEFNLMMKTSIGIWRGKPQLLGMSFAVCMLGAVLAVLISALVFGRRIFLLLLPAAVLGTELLVGHAPRWKGLACFWACAAAAFSGEWETGRVHLRVHRSGQEQGIFARLLRLCPGLCLAAVTALVLAGSSVVFEKPAAGFMERAPAAREFQRNAERSLADLASGLFAGQRVDILNQPPHYTGREVMKVTASQKPADDLYLKGFYGTDYKEGGWVCEQQAFAGACGEAGYSLQKASEELLQAQYNSLSDSRQRAAEELLKSAWQSTLPEGLDISGGTDASSPHAYLQDAGIDYTLEYTGNWGSRAYLPYVIDYSVSRGAGRLTGDVSMQKSWGAKKFEFSGLNCEIDALLIELAQDAAGKGVFRWYDTFAESAYLKGSRNMPTIQEYVERLDDSSEDGFVYHLNIDFFSTGSMAESGTGPAVSSRELMIFLRAGQRWLEQGGVSDRNRGRAALAYMVGDMLLKQPLTYSMDLDRLDDGTDAVNYFLTESRKGFCIHFASAAVLMLRELGVPARYASGYVVRQEDFYLSGGVYTASVKDNAAHAWAEIYLDGIGWIPVDVTPGDSRHGAYAGNGQQPDSEKQESQSTGGDTDTEDTRTEDAGDTQTEDTAAQDTRAGDEEDDREKNDGAGNWRYRFLLQQFGRILLCLVLLVLAVLLSRAVFAAVRRYRRVLGDDLRAGKYRSAVLRLNRRIYRRLMLQGKIRRRNMTDAEYDRVLKAAYPYVAEEDWNRYMRIVRAAVFSGEELESADAYFCHGIYRGLRRKRGRK